MEALIEGLKFVMWEKTDMPESAMSKDEKGKTIFVKTGNKIEKTTYTFKDEYGDKLVLMAGNEWRGLEMEKVDVLLAINYDDFNRKVKVTLKKVSISE